MGSEAGSSRVALLPEGCDPVGVARFPDDVLEKVAQEHVGYELRHLCTLAGAATHAVVAPDGTLHVRPQDEPIQTALLEAYLLHARNLAEFLTASPRKLKDCREDDGVYAVDYFDEAPSRRWRPFTAEDSARLNKYLSHITSVRLSETDWRLRAEDPDRTGWADLVLKHMGEFLNALREVHPGRARWFDGPMSTAVEELLRSRAGLYLFARVDGRP